MLAIMKPARLAPPAAATMSGRGQFAAGALLEVLGLHLFSVIQRSIASSIGMGATIGTGATFFDATRRTVWLSPNTTAIIAINTARPAISGARSCRPTPERYVRNG